MLLRHCRVALPPRLLRAAHAWAIPEELPTRHANELSLIQHQRNDAGRFKAVLLDVAGTLMVPSEPTATVYARYARATGHLPPPPEEILARFRNAYNTPFCPSGAQPIRYVADGRAFWRHVVQESTGCYDEAMFEGIYQYFAHARAWRVAPGAADALARLRATGVRTAVVSNFDTRLRPLLRELRLDHLFDTIVVSAEVGCEKPNPCIFEAALDALHVAPEDAVHVGDDRRNDQWGARDARVHAWLWGEDISSFRELADRVIHGKKYQQW